MTRGIIEMSIDRHHYKVRIPEYNGVVNSDDDYVSTDELYTATVCSQPNGVISYKAGDVVFVDFERDNVEMPVIMGLVQGANHTYTASDMMTDSITVGVNCILPSATKIGDVSSNELQQLIGVRNNIQRQIDLINEKINAIIIYNKNEGE